METSFCIWVFVSIFILPQVITTSIPSVISKWKPSTVIIGKADAPGGAPAMQNIFGARYQYLSGDVTDISNNWFSWQEAGPPYGLFVERYILESGTYNSIPVLSYYMIVQSSPDQYDESDTPTKMQNAVTMQDYFVNMKQFFVSAGKYPNITVVFHVEPDMWGFLEKAATIQDDATSVPIKVKSSGFSDVSAYDDTLRGFANAILHLRDTYAPNVLVAYHLSVWGTNTDITYQNSLNSTVVQLATRAANWYLSLNANFDLVFTDMSDRDSGFYNTRATDNSYCAPGKPGCDYWWDEEDFSRTILFYETFVELAQKRMIVWQIPMGNTKMKACDNQNQHYQDNRPEWLLGDSTSNMNRFSDAGVIGFLFGGGNGNCTCACDATGDGITNPAAINGNTLASYNADDDGGYFAHQVGIYNTNPIPLTPGTPISDSPEFNSESWILFPSWALLGIIGWNFVLLFS